MATECEKSHISSVIPQIFFDIIARVIPGFIIFNAYLVLYLHIDGYIGMVKSWFGTGIASSSNQIQINSPILLFFFIIILSYAIGMLLWGIRYGINLIFHKNDIYFDLETGIKLDDNVTREQFSLDYCNIKKEESLAGTRLTKVKAEIHMTMALTSGFALAFIFVILANAQFILVEKSYSFELYAIPFLLMFFASEAAGIHFKTHMKNSIENIITVCSIPSEHRNIKDMEQIHEIQIEEGNTPCFRPNNNLCTQTDCRWRNNCLGMGS